MKKVTSEILTKQSALTNQCTASATGCDTQGITSIHFSSASVSQSSCVQVNCSSSQSVQNVGKGTFKIPSDILDDLASRFIINAPDMELSNLIRVCFQIELAHWFYLDFFCTADSETEERKIVPCGMKQFSTQLFQHIPFLRHHLPTIDQILEDWKHYKLSVPTYGAILISEDLKYCLLVQSYFAKSSWSFPKGKINENEEPEHCAAREVFEETGYDITDSIVPEDYIEAVINFQYTRLYIVKNVSLQTQFSPRTRNEIKCCDWFPIDALPTNKNDVNAKAKLGMNANSFFMIMPFIKRLKKWVSEVKNGIKGQSNASTTPTTTTANPLISAALTGNVSGFEQQFNNNNSNNNNSCKTTLINQNKHALGANNVELRIKTERHKTSCDLKNNTLSGSDSKYTSEVIYFSPRMCMSNKTQLTNSTTSEIYKHDLDDSINNRDGKMSSPLVEKFAKPQPPLSTTSNQTNLFKTHEKKIHNGFGCFQKTSKSSGNENSQTSVAKRFARKSPKKCETISSTIVSTIRLDKNNDDCVQDAAFHYSDVNFPYTSTKVSDILTWKKSMDEIINPMGNRFSFQENSQAEHFETMQYPMDWDMPSRNEIETVKPIDRTELLCDEIIRFPKSVNTKFMNADSKDSSVRHNMKFTPNCNTWKNFTFTKNFIANVFC